MNNIELYHKNQEYELGKSEALIKDALYCHEILSDCEKFGMTYGCRPDCPVWCRWKCRELQLSNVEMFCKEYPEEMMAVIENGSSHPERILALVRECRGTGLYPENERQELENMWVGKCVEKNPENLVGFDDFCYI